MRPSTLLLVLASSALSFAAPLPIPAAQPDKAGVINITHHSASTGLSTHHTIDALNIDPALAKSIEGSTININLVGEKRASSSSKEDSEEVVDAVALLATKEGKTPTKDDKEGHEVHVDASGKGIHGSTVNINISRRSPSSSSSSHRVRNLKIAKRSHHAAQAHRDADLKRREAMGLVKEGDYRLNDAVLPRFDKVYQMAKDMVAFRF